VAGDAEPLVTSSDVPSRLRVLVVLTRALTVAVLIVVTLQMIADLLLLGIVLRAFLNAVGRGRARQRETPPPTIRTEHSD
jgi:hypothetical protein